MRKVFVALGLAAALMVGSVAVDGRVISVAVPGGPEIAATLTTVDTAEATHGGLVRSGCRTDRLGCGHRH